MIRHALATHFLLLTVTLAGAQSSPLSIEQTILLPGVTGKFDPSRMTPHPIGSLPPPLGTTASK